MQYNEVIHDPFRVIIIINIFFLTRCGLPARWKDDDDDCGRGRTNVPTYLLTFRPSQQRPSSFSRLPRSRTLRISHPVSALLGCK